MNCKTSDWSCVYHACMSDDCQKRFLLEYDDSWGPGNCKDENNMDYEIDSDVHCPECSHYPLHHRTCTNLHCADGFIDLHDEDPINFMPGEDGICKECKGTDVEWWCPKCGVNLSGNAELSKQFKELNDIEDQTTG